MRFLFLILVLVISLPFVSAITGSIGNAKMILREDAGKEIIKSILVRNVNDVKVKIELEVIGDIKDLVKLNEDNFYLNAGEEKNAGFTIKANEEGTYEGKIVVKFVPDEGNSVALASNIILIAGGDNVKGDTNDTKVDNTNNIEDITDENNDELIDVTGGTVEKVKKTNPLIGVLITTAIILIGLIIAVLFLIKGGDIKKGERKSKR